MDKKFKNSLVELSCKNFLNEKPLAFTMCVPINVAKKKTKEKKEGIIKTTSIFLLIYMAIIVPKVCANFDEDAFSTI